MGSAARQLLTIAFPRRKRKHKNKISQKEKDDFLKKAECMLKLLKAQTPETKIAIESQMEQTSNPKDMKPRAVRELPGGNPAAEPLDERPREVGAGLKSTQLEKMRHELDAEVESFLEELEHKTEPHRRKYMEKLERYEAQLQLDEDEKRDRVTETETGKEQNDSIRDPVLIINEITVTEEIADEIKRPDWQGKVAYHVIRSSVKKIITMGDYLKNDRLINSDKHMVRCPELGLNDFQVVCGSGSSESWYHLSKGLLEYVERHFYTHKPESDGPNYADSINRLSAAVTYDKAGNVIRTDQCRKVGKGDETKYERMSGLDAKVEIIEGFEYCWKVDGKFVPIPDLPEECE